MSKSFDLSGVGQKGHNTGTRNTPVLDAEVKASHAHAAKLSQVHEYDAQDQKDATGDLGKYTRTSDDVREEASHGMNDQGPTYATAQENSNIRGGK